MKAPVIDHRAHDTDPVARLNREALRQAGVLTINLLGGPGSGKTSLIAHSIERLMPDIRAGVIACDIASHRDADRISQASDQVVQVNTGRRGVVEPSHIYDALRWLDLKSLDLLFIENVGTLSMPAIPDLGHDVAAVVFSVAAGDDKADRHPDLVRAADVVVLNKTDLLCAVPFNRDAFRADVRRLNPDAQLVEASALRGQNIDRWLNWLKARLPRDAQKVSHWFG